MDNHLIAPDTAVLSRRHLLQGGLGSLAVAGLAACTGKAKKPAAATPTTTVKKTDHDRTALRTASSIELLAVDVYKQLTTKKVLATPAATALAKLFMSQHQEHADFIIAETKKRDGKAYEHANSVLMQNLQAQLEGATSEQAALNVVLGIERMAAATYLAAIGAYDDPTLNEVTMSVGGVEARHVAVISQMLGQPAAQDAFGSTAGAVAPGTGVG
jgi:rubrerythrin